jgi:cell division protein FtsW (lipid II flippase)
MADPVLLPVAGLLAGIGFAVIFRLDSDLATEQGGWLVVGLLVFVAVVALVREHQNLDQFTYTLGLLGMVFLLLPIMPNLGPIGGREINGARLWFEIGPLTFQPAEVGKVLLVIFLASYLNAKKELLAIATRKLGPFQLPEPKHLGPLLVAWAVSLAILFLEKDLGSSLLFFAIFVVMLYVATARGTYLVAGLVLFAIGAVAGWLVFAHVQFRVDLWLHALDEARVAEEGASQLAQSIFALSTGGTLGTGLGQGAPYLIPSASTDFIFSALGEELGLLGTVGILLLFFTLVVRGFRTAVRRDDGFGKLLAVGLSTSLAVQTFVIVGGVTRLIPLTGITLPFVSYGGSSLVANFALLALLARVSAATEPAGAKA